VHPKLIEVDDARALVLARTRELADEPVALAQSLGRVIAP